VLLVDAHEVSRAACSALLRTEGLSVVDVAPDGDVIARARELDPAVALVDARSGTGFGSAAQQLRNMPRAPLVVLTSSAERDRLSAFIARLPFLAKADVCAEAIMRVVGQAADESSAQAGSR
jgi:DNA-binding NarL/FixJ family response regulator